MNGVTIGFLISCFTFLISIATLVYKYAKVVSMVERNTKQIAELEKENRQNQPVLSQCLENAKDIKEIKETHKEFRGFIEQTLAEINKTLNSMDKSLALLTSRLDYVEKGKAAK